MEQLRAISCCSRPRSWRRRSTSLILRMDKPSWGIQFLLWPRGEIEAGCPAPLFAPNQKCDPETSISIRVPTPQAANPIFTSPESVFTSPECLFTSPESVFTSRRNLYSHHSGISIHIHRNTHSGTRDFGSMMPFVLCKVWPRLVGGS